MTVELFPFLQEVAAHFVASLIEHTYIVLGRTNLTSTHALHRRDLRERVKNMPFIYRDLEGDVVNDFVDPDLHAVDIESLSPSPGRAQRVQERIRVRKRVLVLGNAGIGKTTFLRYEILLLLKDKGRLGHYMDGERLLPFYVPLKALDNSQPYPIVRYLIANNLYLHANGLKRLTKLGRDQQLFLFLDGYDEIEAGTKNTDHPTQDNISTEFKYLLQSDDLRKAIAMPAEYRAFYEAAQRCRVWISSRKEFFLLNPIQFEDVDVAGNGTHPGQPTLPQGRVKEAIAIHLAGIGHNRHQLAEKIFDKYRRRSHRYEDILSAEYFLQEIDHSPDQVLVGLSYNPLFLTVMAYIYAAKAIALGSHEVTFGSTLSDLILECISLLLVDVDKEKARGLPVAYKAALLRRRNDYVEEKRAFLFYFASRLLYEEKNLFDLQYLREQAIRFFKDEHSGHSNQVIIRELEAPIGASSDIATQLIYAGLFVLVDRTSDGTSTYDFPHRRFREVLSSQYFDARADRATVVERCLERHDLTETLYVYFSISRFKDEIVSAILARVRSSKERRFGNILLHCLEQASEQYDASPLLESFLFQAMLEDSVFDLPYGVLNHIRNNVEIVTQVVDKLQLALMGNQINVGSLGCSLLSFLDQKALRRTLLEGLAKGPTDDGMIYVIHRYLWDTDRDYCVEHIAELTRRPYLAIGIFRAIAEDALSDRTLHEVCVKILRQLPFSRSAVFISILDGVNERLVTFMVTSRALSGELERIVALIRAEHEMTDERYAMTHSAVDAINKVPTNLALPGRIGATLSRKDIEEMTEGLGKRARLLLRECYLSGSIRSWASTLRKYRTKEIPMVTTFFHS